MRPFWRGALLLLLIVGIGLILWLPWPWNLAVGVLVGFKLSAILALSRGLGRGAPFGPPPPPAEEPPKDDPYLF